MITMIVSTAGHVLLSITVYLEGSRFALQRPLVRREPVVAASIHGRLRTQIINTINTFFIIPGSFRKNAENVKRKIGSKG